MLENGIKPPCDLDKDSVDFLEAKLGAKINPHLNTEKDYYRAVFYFKCCALQEEVENFTSNDKLYICNCFYSKEKADMLFENIYAHALEYRDLLEKTTTDASLMGDLEKIFTSGYAAETATLNEHLTPHLHNIKDDRDIGNAQILKTASLAQLNGYLHAFPNLTGDMSEKYSAVVTMAAADIAPHLKPDTNLRDYLPIIKEHPKAVLALAIVAKANKEEKKPFTLSSPEELLSKCQQPDIIALSDKISFNDLNGSKKEAYAHARPLGKEQIKAQIVSHLKVNEG